MKKELFEQLVEPLGEFRRKWGGHSADEAYEDKIFVPEPTHKPCGDCDLMVKGRVIILERKVDKDDTFYWRTKCATCKKKWKELRL
jgi:ssDNA-binding Zn-finger/Zn-ribbon topoisomerase 1